MLPTVLSQGVNIFLIPLYTRVLSPEDYGALDMLRVFGSICLLVVALEISQAFARFFSDENSREGKIEFASTALWHTVIAFLVFLILALAFQTELSKVIIGMPGYENFFSLGLIWITINGIFLQVSMQFRYELRSKDYSIANIITFLITALFSVVLAYIYKWGLLGMITANIIGTGFGLVYSLVNVRHNIIFKVNTQKLKILLRYSIPLVPSGIAVFVNGYTDRIMINHFLSLEDVGLYGMGFRVSAIVSLLLVGFNRALSPLIINNYRKKETPEHIATIFRYFVALSLVFFACLTMFSYEILWLITTPDYYGGSKVVPFLVPAILLSQLYIFAPGIGIAKKTQITMYINLIGAMLNIALNYMLIPRFGFIGAGMATLISHLIIFIAKMRYSQKFYKIPFKWANTILCTCLVILIVVAGLNLPLAHSVNFLIKVACLPVLLLVFIKTKIIEYSELNHAFSKLKKIVLN